MNERPRRTAIVIAVVALAAALPAAAQQIYRYKDENGQWVLTDRRPPSSSPTETVALKGLAASPRIAVEARPSVDGVQIVAVNECRCPVEFGVRAAGQGGGEQAVREVVGPRSERVLLSLPPSRGDAQVRFDYGYVMGDPTATHAPPMPYRAPFALAKSYGVTQAPPDAVTHRDPGSRYAIDFAMPVGSAVHAAREGMVIDVSYRNFRNGTSPELRTEANYVQILHDDGTTAVYAHLQMDTVRVRPGQRVARGEYIANSGNTGFSTGPHLHFVVLRNAGLRNESVPVTFAGAAGAPVSAHSGRSLTAY
jgi:murein DD-endopeptidase MepM/ murein hydrolase activator NlpD